MNTKIFQVETQCGKNNHHCFRLSVIFNVKKNMFAIFYQSRLIPVHMRPSAKGYNLLSFFSFYQNVVTTPQLLYSLICLPVCMHLTYRWLQPSLIFQLLLEGSSNPLALVLDHMFNTTQAPTYRKLAPSLFLEGPRFMNFQT